MSPAAQLAAGWALAASVMLVLWLRQQRTRNATSVDVAWAANLGLLAVLYALTGEGALSQRVLIAMLAAAASWRLARHLYQDRVAGAAEEDGRYRTLRASWGPAAGARFFVFYQAQALLDVVLSVPFLLACANPEAPGALETAGALLWSAALAGEAVADRQLARFKADAKNRGRTCRVGLWRFSRHPNYFFEWLAWCAYALVAWSAPHGWIAVSSPLLMLFLILRVTGIPPTEAQAVLSRGDDYRAYQRTTSAFFPWFPREETAT